VAKSWEASSAPYLFSITIVCPLALCPPVPQEIDRKREMIALKKLILIADGFYHGEHTGFGSAMSYENI
jgi:hypothetical protein